MKKLIVFISLLISTLVSGAYNDENTLWGLSHQTHEAQGEAKAVLLLTHGLIHHSGKFPHVLEMLKENNIKVVTYDTRGHGKS